MKLNVSERLKYLQANLTADKLTNVGYPVFVAHTTKRTGNARSKTVKNGTEIDANYPYAKRLDQGWSKVNAQGMIKPTIDAVRNYIKQVTGK